MIRRGFAHLLPDQQDRDLEVADQMIRDTAQPGAPDPTTSVGGHDDQVDVHLPDVVHESGTRPALARKHHGRGDLLAVFSQLGLHGLEVHPLGFPGRRLRGREEPGCIGSEGGRLVHERQAQLAACLSSDAGAQRYRLLSERRAVERDQNRTERRWVVRHCGLPFSVEPLRRRGAGGAAATRHPRGPARRG